MKRVQNFWNSLNLKENDFPIFRIADNNKLMSEIVSQKLPKSYEKTLDNAIYPISCKINERHNNHDGALVVGVNGGQGSGKSTLSLFLKIILEDIFDKRTTIISIDDLYKTRSEREDMSKNTHKMFMTRGVPGTHDVNLGIKTIKDLKDKKSKVQLPSFNKSIDDRETISKSETVEHQPDIILFEGWCIGVESQSEEELLLPINSLEKLEDKDGIWRNFVNMIIDKEYRELFNLIDYLIMLKVPSFEKVKEWRELQEDKLRETNLLGKKVMNSDEVKRFVEHYERLTKHMLNDLPRRSDIVINIDDSHNLTH